MLSRNPNSTQRIFEHSQSIYWIGFKNWELGNYTEAEYAFNQYKELGLKLVEYEPQNLRWQLELAYAESNLGTFALHQLKKPRQALAAFSAALELFQNISAVRTNDLSVLLDLADAHGWVSDTAKITDGVFTALEHRHAQKKILSRLVEAYPENIKIFRRSIAPKVAEGQIWLEMKEYKIAIKLFRRCVNMSMSLIKRDSSNLQWQHDYLINQLNLAHAYFSSGDHGATIDVLESVRPIIETAEYRENDSVRVLTEINIMYQMIKAKYLVGANNYTEANSITNNALTILQENETLVAKSERGRYLAIALNALKAKITAMQGNHNTAHKISSETIKHYVSDLKTLSVEAILELEHLASTADNHDVHNQLLIRLKDIGVSEKTS